MGKLIISLMLFVYASSCFSYDLIPDRRKDQFPTQPAHLFLPLPYSKPGIGDGFVFLGNASNVAETTADITGFLVTGDAEGHIINGNEIALYPDILFLDVYLQQIDRATVNNYSIRGINNTGKDDYNLLDLSVANETKIDISLTFFERRFNLIYSYSDSEFQVDAIRDNKGALITNFSQPFKGSETRDRYTMLFDFTDDYLDPRKGFKFEMAYQDKTPGNLNEPDFYTLDYSLLGYVPMGQLDTLVLNYYQSGAHVRRRGNTDPTSIRAEINANCSPADTVCLTAEQELVDNFINARTYGSSETLGGDLRLRSFPQSRYQGAHTAFIGAEYRWNFKQEAKPFDYFIWKDVRTGLQVAFFAEIGTVSETSSTLWDETRYSVGAGFRLIAASGSVYRFDIAVGSEGGADPIIIFEYPW